MIKKKKKNFMMYRKELLINIIYYLCSLINVPTFSPYCFSKECHQTLSKIIKVKRYIIGGIKYMQHTHRIIPTSFSVVFDSLFSFLEKVYLLSSLTALQYHDCKFLHHKTNFLGEFFFFSTWLYQCVVV
jgi:hypothetical protein